MNYLRNILKKAVFWTYPRTSWQWDVLCVLILAFIFLTPKSWFDPGQTTVVISSDVIGAQADIAEIELRAKQAAGRMNGEVTAIHEQRDAAGKLVAYEVDIH
jgi:hypothetical protein